jgi:Zn finger protein HypA/HybF involved in hydrogenase expression
MHEIGLIEETIEYALACAAERSTPAETAEIRIELVAGVCICTYCEQEFAPAGALKTCPHCQPSGALVQRGREFELAMLEVS